MSAHIWNSIIFSYNASLTGITIKTILRLKPAYVGLVARSYGREGITN